MDSPLCLRPSSYITDSFTDRMVTIYDNAIVTISAQVEDELIIRTMEALNYLPEGTVFNFYCGNGTFLMTINGDQIDCGKHFLDDDLEDDELDQATGFTRENMGRIWELQYWLDGVFSVFGAPLSICDFERTAG